MAGLAGDAAGVVGTAVGPVAGGGGVSASVVVMVGGTAWLDAGVAGTGVDEGIAETDVLFEVCCSLLQLLELAFLLEGGVGRVVVVSLGISEVSLYGGICTAPSGADPASPRADPTPLGAATALLLDRWIAPSAGRASGRGGGVMA